MRSRNHKAERLILAGIGISLAAFGIADGLQFAKDVSELGGPVSPAMALLVGFPHFIVGLTVVVCAYLCRLARAALISVIAGGVLLALWAYAQSGYFDVREALGALGPVLLVIFGISFARRSDPGSAIDEPVEGSQRWWFANVWLWFMMVANLLMALVGLSLALSGYLSTTGTPVPAQIYYVAASLIQIICLWAIFKWQMWGWWGLVLIFVSTSVVNVARGYSLALCTPALLVIALTYLALRGGGDRAVWPRLRRPAALAT